MKEILLKTINVYQKFLSPLKKQTCVFYPSCSTYSKEAIKKYGALRGSLLSIKRILRCHPWQKERIDFLK